MARSEVRSLARLLEGQHRDLRRRILTLLSERRFAASPGLPREEYRELVLKWCRALAREGLGGLGYPAEFGGQGDPAAGIVAFQTIAFHDLSLVVKFGVQFGLFGGAIANLGTERHHVRYLPKVASLALPGCFAMTETGHGSNVRDIRTTARYDPKSRGFVVHTPNAEDRKDYIGNAALHGRTAVVFAQTGGGRRAPRGPRPGRADPRRPRQPSPRGADRGLRRQARVERRGQRPHPVRSRSGASNGVAEPVR